MQGLGIAGSALLVDEPVNEALTRSARNLPRVKATQSTAINIVDILKYESIVLTEAAARRVAEVLG
jgi:large subunit ribosomal protein L4